MEIDEDASGGRAEHAAYQQEQQREERCHAPTRSDSVRSITTMQDLAMLIRTEDHQLRTDLAARMQRMEDKQDDLTKRHDEVQKKRVITATKLGKLVETRTDGQAARGAQEGRREVDAGGRQHCSTTPARSRAATAETRGQWRRSTGDRPRRERRRLRLCAARRRGTRSSSAGSSGWRSDRISLTSCCMRSMGCANLKEMNVSSPYRHSSLGKVRALRGPRQVKELLTHLKISVATGRHGKRPLALLRRPREDAGGGRARPPRTPRCQQ